MATRPYEGLVEKLAQPGGRLFLFVMDGLGGLPHPKTGLTELESARTPNLDALIERGALGQLIPVAPGVTPGSAPAHLALFGYDPVTYQIGRGVLSAVGVGMDLSPDDVAARLNFATFDGDIVVDRRAGRLATEVAAELCRRLREGLSIPGVEVDVQPEQQYRAVVVLRGEGLDAALTDSDPQVEGRAPLPVQALRPEAEKTAAIVNELLKQARAILASEPVANGLLIRGFGKLPAIPTLQQRFGLNPGVIAAYPMYRGLARLVGMEVLATDTSPDSYKTVWDAHSDGYDYVFMHIKETDAAGEDGDFDRKVAVIEAFDAMLPHLLRRVDLERDVVVVTGDHSTPAMMRSHSWHPVPMLMAAKPLRRESHPNGFGERECARGALGTFSSQHLMPLMLAAAGRLKKFGA